MTKHETRVALEITGWVLGMSAVVATVLGWLTYVLYLGLGGW